MAVTTAYTKNLTLPRYGWLGSKQRSGDALAGVLLMGVRLYSPALGRFLQVDPVPGGSANAYDYCNAGPVNCTDLDGRWPNWLKRSGKWAWKHRMGIVSTAAFGACVFATAGACMVASGIAYGAGVANRTLGFVRARGWRSRGGTGRFALGLAGDTVSWRVPKPVRQLARNGSGRYPLLGALHTAEGRKRLGHQLGALGWGWQSWI